jgi:beta-lactamase class A
MNTLDRITLNYLTPTDPDLQAQLEAIDTRLRNRFGISPEQTAIGVLDLQTGRLAMVRPDHEEYAASVAKIGILLAYFELHPEAATALDPVTRHELGMMIKISSNEMAAKFSRELGLSRIQQVLNAYGFYDPAHGGGIWVGKHYGQDSERVGDPVGNNSHAATVRQLLRFYLLLEQGKLVSPAASRTMREIFASPDLPHDDIKFVKGLGGRDVTLLRKWGSWEDWLHDSAVISGPGWQLAGAPAPAAPRRADKAGASSMRHYVLVGLTHHPRGDDYLVELAAAVDDCLRK